MDSTNFSSLQANDFIPPDYSGDEHEVGEVDDIITGPTDDDDDDFDEDIDESIISEPEDDTDDLLFEKTEKATEKSKVNMSPFNIPTTTPVSTTPSWWQQANSGAATWQPANSSPWQANSKPSWASGWNSNNQKIEINRSKKIIFCDLLDCLVETYQSNGTPGLRPRDIYDFKFRFDVWQKLAAFNPEKIYALAPQNLIPAAANGSDSWEITLSYICFCLSSFLRLKYSSCQILVQSQIGQPKEEIIKSVIERSNLNREEIIQVGIYSGINGLSDIDKMSAQNSKIDYIDLYQLLNAQ